MLTMSFLRSILPTAVSQRLFTNSAKQTKSETQKTYHKKATGPALVTVKKHAKDSDLRLYGSCFCPFVQRVWIALEIKNIPYQYIEVDPYKKPESLLQINPRGLIPAITHGSFSLYESSVIVEYLEDINQGTNPLLTPGNPQMRAHSRLWADHVNRKIVPAFYSYLQAQELDKQTDYAIELKDGISKLVDAADPHGPYFLGQHMTLVDVDFAPWMIRLSRVLTPYRGWPAPEPGSRWGAWIDAIENTEAVRATTSTDDLYLDSYERYAGLFPTS
jgi:glutathione S-transferase